MKHLISALCSVLILLPFTYSFAIANEHSQAKPQVFNVKAFGAIGDGSHDDTTAIQAAIDAAKAAGGGEVFVPTGKYFLTSSLAITSAARVSLRGTGFSTHLFFENRAGIATGIVVSKSEQVEISNLRVTGSTIPTLSRGIYISFSDGVRVHNIWQAGATLAPNAGPLAGLGTTESSDIWITDCDVSGNGFAVGPDVFNNSYDIVQFSGSASGVHFRNNKVHDSSTAFSIALIDVQDSDMIGNSVNQVNRLGTNHGGSGYGLMAYGGKNSISKIQIDNNTIKNTAGTGIYIASVNYLEAKQNYIESTVLRQETLSLPLAGIALNGVSHANVSGGWVRGSRLTGIDIAGGQFINIKDITITSPGTDGIKIAFASDITIQGTTIERPSGQGIYAPVGAKESRLQITDNVINMPAKQGIYLDWVEDSNISNNTIVSAGEKAILVTNPSTLRLKVRNNEIKGIPANQVGIAIYGAQHLISDNTLVAGNDANSIGIDTNNSTSDSIISGNRVSGFGIGIFDAGGMRNEISRNTLSGNRTPLNISATSRAVDNH